MADYPDLGDGLLDRGELLSVLRWARDEFMDHCDTCSPGEMTVSQQACWLMVEGILRRAKAEGFFRDVA